MEKPESGVAMAAAVVDVEVNDASLSENDGNQNNIDLFAVPHTRMRDLVSWPLSEVAAATDLQDLEPCLQAVYEAMWELKTHEYIENNYIMNRLKARLQTKRVSLELKDEPDTSMLLLSSCSYIVTSSFGWTWARYDLKSVLWSQKKDQGQKYI